MSGFTRRQRVLVRARLDANPPPPSGVPRSFAAHPGGQVDVLDVESAVRLAGVSAAASAAYDIMTDDGFPPEEAWKFALAAEKQGKDPEAFARHFVKLRKAARGL